MSSSGESDMELSNTPPDVINEANSARLDLLPKKSAELYEKQYNMFVQWCNEKKINKYSENVLLAYFSIKAKQYKASTLWSMFSMLKATLIAKNKLNIGTFSNLIAYLKRQGKGYKAKKSMVFTRSEINKFLLEAPDELHLMHKVCLILGIAGACRRQELRNINIRDIDDRNDILIIKIPDTKTGKPRMFTVTDEICSGVSALQIYRKYANLRPAYVNHNTFFINYRKGKCCNQVVGVHTFGSIPSIIAKYLNLPNISSYTGHCFRRTSASLLADAGADILTLKRHGGWRSSTVAENYVEDSLSNKLSIADKILNSNYNSNNNQDQITAAGTSKNTQIIHTNNEAMNAEITSNVNKENINVSEGVTNMYNCSVVINNYINKV